MSFTPTTLNSSIDNIERLIADDLDVDSEEGDDNDDDEDVEVHANNKLHKEPMTKKGKQCFAFIDNAKLRTNQEYAYRNSFLRLLWKAFLRTKLQSALMTVNKHGTVRVFSTSGDFFSFIAKVSDYYSNADNFVGVDIAEVVAAHQGENVTLSFHKLKAIAEDLGISSKLIEEAEIKITAMRQQGKIINTQNLIKESVTNTFEILSDEISVESTHCASRRDEPTHIPASGTSAGVTSSTSTNILEAAAEAPQSVLNSVDGFNIWWRNTKLIKTPEMMEKLNKIPQDIIDEITGLSSKNPEWLQARIGLITGSSVGSFLGCGYVSKKDSIDKMILGQKEVNVYVKQMMVWGTVNEENAKKVCIHQLKYIFKKDVIVRTHGLTLNKQYPEFGYSCDGIIEIPECEENMLLEIKCPAHNKYLFRDPTLKGTPIYGNHDWPNGKTGPVPTGYWCQIQLGMFMTNLKRCCFFTWTPAEARCEFVDFDELYVTKILLPKSRAVYWDEIMPVLMQKAKELNQPVGSVDLDRVSVHS